jgi:hypothetical protein
MLKSTAKIRSLNMANITIEVDPKIAQSFKNLKSTEQKKLSLLLGMWLEEAITNQESLGETLDKCSQQAIKNGLTPEILAAILSETDE